MKQQILFAALLFFSVVGAMDEPAKPGKLLFPFPEKTTKDLWQMVRETHMAHYYFLESDLFMSLPGEIRQGILRLWFMLHNPASFSTHEDQFFRKMLTACIRLSCREKEWNFDFLTQATADGRYYVYHKAPTGDSTIKIYDRTNKRTIQLLCDYRDNTYMLQWKALLKKNIIIFIRDAELLFYDIEKDKEYCYKDIFSFSCNGKFWVSDNERYVCVCDQDSYCVLDVTSLDDIKRYPFDAGAATINNIAFSFDGTYFIASLDDQTICLWMINNNDLTKHSCCDARGWGREGMCFTHNSEYTIRDFQLNQQVYIQAIKIEKNEAGFSSLKPSFCAPYYLWGIFKDVIIAHDPKENLVIIDGAGKVLHTFQEKQPLCNADPSRKYIFQRSRKDRNKIIISRLLHDKNGYYCGIQQDTIVSPSMGTFANKQATITRYVEATHDVYTDLNGRLLGSMNGRAHSEFTSHGNAVIREGKKLIFHPKGADEHFEKLAHRSLTLPKLAALEKVCNEAEEIHKLLLMQDDRDLS